MKNKKILSLLLLLLPLLLNALTLTDDFNNLNGWSNNNDGTLSKVNGRLNFQAESSNAFKGFTKTYDFGTANANTNVAITFDAWTQGGWETSDKVRFYYGVNSELLAESSFPGVTGSGEASYSYTLNAITDTNGLLMLTFQIKVSDYRNEQFQLDNMVLIASNEATAVDDDFQTGPNVVLSENVFTNDYGPGIVVTKTNTGGLNGTLSMDVNTGDFTFTPTTGFTGTTSFTYDIEDENGVKSGPATVTILVNTQVSSGFQDFKLINPPDTRNIIGNYVMIGNTVECLADINTGICTVDQSAKNDDPGVVPRYINIDASAGKTNSSSANFILPPEYDPTVGIMWVGLFWQGSIGIGTQNNAKLIDMKIDTNAYINDIQASTIYYTPGSASTHYAGFADVTQKFKDANLLAGKHTVTVADIYTDDGGGGAEDNYGGWSLVVIYKHTGADAKAYNVSVYNGWAALYSTANPKTEETATITGFKLPITGIVDATFSAFAGEGELEYGGTEATRDSMSISADGTNWTSVGTSPYNVFDSALPDTISRDNVGENIQKNTDGIDVEDYNVSSLMTAYRDSNNNIDTVQVRLEAYEDRVNISMMAFATELYKPRVCYEEKIFRIIDNGDGTFTESEITTEGTEVNFNDEIRTKVLVQNDSSEVAEKISITRATGQETVLPYLAGKTYYDNNNPADFNSITLTYATEAYDTDLFSFISGVFGLNLGENATSDAGGDLIPLAITPTGNQKQRAYFEYSSNIKSEDNVSFAYFVSYKNDALNLTFTNEVLPKCTDFNNSFWGRQAVVPSLGGMDTVDVYDYPGSTGAEYTGGSIYNTNGDGPGPDLTTKVAGETTAFDVVYLGDGTSGPVGFHPGDATAIAMPVLLYLYELNTTTNVYDKVGPLIDTNGKIAHASLEPGAVFATSVPLSIPNSAKRNVKIGMHYVDMNGNSEAASRNCYIHSSLNSNLQDVPACLNNEDNIYHIFGAVTKARCTELWTMDNGEGQNPGTYGPCTSSYGAAGEGGNTPLKAPYNVEPMCLSCLLDNENSALSVDSFAIRPKDFVLNSTVVQSDNAAIVLDQSGTHPVTGPNKLRSGQDYNLTVVARNMAGTNTIDYNQSTDKLNPVTVHLLSNLALDSANLCADVNVTYGTVTQFVDGFDPYYMMHYNEVGVIDIDLNDTDWAAIDSDDTPTTATYTHFAGGTRYGSSIKGALRLTVKPYDFNISAANVFDNNNPSGFTYLSDDINMTARLPITIRAQNKDGNVTQNYSNMAQGLYEQFANFAFTLDPTSYPASLTVVPYLPVNNADLPFNSGIAVISETDDNVTRFNFDRNVNVPVNPFKIDGSDVNLSITDTDNVYGDANGTFIGDATFVYGRVHMPRVRAMCSGSPCAGNMTFFFEFYGDKDANKTLITNLVGTPAPRSLDSVNWYRNTAHNTNTGDGNVTASTTNVPGIVDYTINGGTTSSAIYNYTGDNGYPYKGTVTVDTAANNTQSWLIYDKYNAATTQVHGELEFYGPGEWSSDTGAESTIQEHNDTTRNKNTNRRIRW